QPFGEAWAQQARVAWSAAVVDEADDRLDVEPAQRRQASIGPRPVGGRRTVRGRRLPEDGVAQRADAERGEALEVAVALGMPVAVELGEVGVPDSVDSAFDAAPHLQGGQG